MKNDLSELSKEAREFFERKFECTTLLHLARLLAVGPAMPASDLGGGFRIAEEATRLLAVYGLAGRLPYDDLEAAAHLNALYMQHRLQAAESQRKARTTRHLRDLLRDGIPLRRKRKLKKDEAETEQ